MHPDDVGVRQGLRHPLGPERDRGNPADSTVDDRNGLTNLDYANATTTKPYPIAIGAKVNEEGVIDPNSDQFNGRIDNAYVAIGRP